MKSKILILGKGFIGARLQETYMCPVSTKRIATFRDVESLIRKHKPKVIINALGHTGKNNVDGCEQALDKTLQSNTYIPLLLAEVALRNKIKLVHLSSGCIYDFDYKKQKALIESHVPDHYGLYYSRSKIYTENALSQLAKRANILIVRVRIPLDDRPHPKNILTKLLKFKSVINLPNSVTYIPDFVQALHHLINIDVKGIFNVVTKGGLRYPYLLEIYKKYYPNFSYQTISLKRLNLTRTNLLLSIKRLEQTGFKVRKTKDVCEECVKNYVKYL